MSSELTGHTADESQAVRVVVANVLNPTSLRLLPSRVVELPGGVPPAEGPDSLSSPLATDGPAWTPWLEQVAAGLSSLDSKIEVLSQQVARALEAKYGAGLLLQEEQPRGADVQGHVPSGLPIKKIEDSIVSTGVPSGTWGDISPGPLAPENVSWSKLESSPSLQLVVRHEYSADSAATSPTVATGTPVASQLAGGASGRRRCSSDNSSTARRRSCARATMLSDKRSVGSLRLWNFLDAPESGSWATCYDVFMRTVIWVGVILPILQMGRARKEGPLASISEIATSMLEVAMDMFFAAELLLRLYACPARRGFFLHIHNMVDALSAMPLLIRACFGFKPHEDNDEDVLAVILLLALVPFLRLLKLFRRSEIVRFLVEALRVLVRAIAPSFILFLIVVLPCSVLMYLFERESTEWRCDSLHKALWLVVVSWTTVGYGDFSPRTFWGRNLMMVLIMLQPLYFAIPVGMVSDAFKNVWQDHDRTVLLVRVRERLVRSGYKPQEVPRLFRLYCTKKDCLELTEFIHMLIETDIGVSREQAVDLFQHIDVDKSGAISAQEFADVVFPAEASKMEDEGAW